MKYCPITYEEINHQDTYSQHGLHLLSPKLKSLLPLPLSAAEQRQEAIIRAGKISIQGVQDKLSARLKVKENCFEIVDQNGHYILKPQSHLYPELPQNEAITMSLAGLIGIEVPVHGLLYSQDGSMTYFIKRFDRWGKNKKYALEDFAQLSGATRDTKYNSSMEKVANIIQAYCTYPALEMIKLFKLTVFNFLIGNEDMHIKNFSIITRGPKKTLSPAYDLLNTTIASKTEEEIALPLDGKKKNLKADHFFKYFAIERLELNEKIIAECLQQIQTAIPQWRALIKRSFLSPAMQQKYLQLMKERCQRLGIDF